jgi:SAM-dependent methyltransferase
VSEADRSSSHARSPATRLLLVSIASLYFELMLIRWLPTQIRVLAYFNNVILISCILGLGLGALLKARPTFAHDRVFALLAGLMVLAFLYHGLDVKLPLSSSDYFLWNGLSRAVTGTVWQYVALFVFFAVNAALMLPIGQILGQAFDRLPALHAYAVNILGALVGLCAFALFSLYSLSPFWWFLTGVALLLPLTAPNRFALVAAAVAILFAAFSSLEAETYWSPYYRITIRPLAFGDRVLGHEVSVNEDSHQQALDLTGKYDSVADLRTRRLIYDEPYRFGHPDTVLVLGAGTGNDVAAALRAGASHVDAVEIDPVILRLGEELHPERPYANAKVERWNAEARTFLRGGRRQYDTIVLGYVDSHSLFSAMSSVRLDNFLYTEEAFRELRSHLKPGGILAVTFTVHERWIADRLYALFARTFGVPPLVFQGAKSSSSGTVFLGGPGLRAAKVEYMAFHPGAPTSDGSYTWLYAGEAEGYLPPTVFDARVATPKDDWPYLYLRYAAIPSNYLLCIVGLFIFSAVTVTATTGLGSIRWGFFFLGAAFLLVETKAMTELAIFLGSTWTVNFFVILTVLCLILAGTLLVLRGWAPTTRLAYLLLAAILIGTYVAPAHDLLGWHSPFRDWVAVALLCAPMFAAAIIFARELPREAEPSAALGSNLLGALAGGVLEYSSMTLGFRSLYLVALALYAMSYIGLVRGRPPATATAMVVLAAGSLLASCV